MDICYIKSKPVLHVVDEATHFQSARFLSRVSTEHVWKALRRCWIDTYMGPPDFLRIDQGSQFKSQVFSQRAEEQGISILEALGEILDGYHLGSGGVLVDVLVGYGMAVIGGWFCRDPAVPNQRSILVGLFSVIGRMRAIQLAIIPTVSDQT